MKRTQKKKVKIPLYFGELVILKCKDFKKLNKKYGIELANEWDAAVFRHTTTEGYTQYFAVFLSKPSIKTIAHEAVHIVNHIFNDRHISLDIFNDEPQAYLTGWVVEQIDNYFKK